MAELNKLEFKYAQNGIEQSYYRSIANTEMGAYIIDAVNQSLITHRTEYKFMRLSDLYSSTNTATQTNYALSIKGAYNLYLYINKQANTNKAELQEEFQSYINAINNRLDVLIQGDNTSGVNRVIDNFREIEDFLKGISDTSTLTGLLKDVYTYIDTSVSRVYTSLEKTNQNVTNLTLLIQQTEDQLTQKINNVSTYIDISINNAFNTITSDINELNDRLTNLELGGGSGNGGVDADVLKNYVQFKDLETYNIKTSYNISNTTDKYTLADVMNIFYTPDIPSAVPAEIIDEGNIKISPNDNLISQTGSTFNYPVISCSGSIRLNDHNGTSPIVDNGMLTAIVTYRSYTAQGMIETTYTTQKELTLTTSNGISSFDVTLSFNSAPRLYYGESNDSNTIVSIQTVLKPLHITYPARTITATNGLLKGTASNLQVALREAASTNIEQKEFSLGYGATTLTYTGYTSGYFYKSKQVLYNITTFIGDQFNPLEIQEFNTAGDDYYFYFILPDNIQYKNLKAIYSMSDNCIDSIYELKSMNLTLRQNLTTTIARTYTAYVLVNAQNKPISLYMEETGKLKIIL